MPWYSSTPALTPVAAWDSNSPGSTTLPDKVGSNHLIYGSGASSASAVSQLPNDYRSMKGNSNPWPCSASITLPPRCVVAGMVKHLRQGILFYQSLFDTNNIFIRQEADLALYTSSNRSGSSVVGMSTGGPDYGAWKFVAVVVGPSQAQHYCNGQFLGSAFSLNAVPASVGGFGFHSNDNGYNLDSDELFVGAGVWSGSPSLADLQALESALRAEFSIPAALHVAALPNLGSLSLGVQGRQPGPPAYKAQTVLHAWKNIYQGGAGTIHGTVTIENIPGARQVRLFDKRTGLVIGETWSSVTGHYEFNNIDPTREYFVVAHDHHRVYNAVVQDMLTP